MNRAPRTNAARQGAGFTLVEVLVSLAILALILVITFSVTGNVASLVTQTRARIDTFQQARTGFEAMNRRISQAMLNTYWDYEYTGNVLTDYKRQSELHFVSGPARYAAGSVAPLLPLSAAPNLQTATHGIFFQTPTGYNDNSGASNNVHLKNLLNVNGYYTEYASNKASRPKFLVPIIPGFSQFRLMELGVPTKKMETYQAITTANRWSWFQNPVKTPSTYLGTRLLAENVIALVIYPQRSPLEPPASGAPTELAPNYYYDSKAYLNTPNALNNATRNQLPPVVQVTMVAIDPASAQRLRANETDPDLYPAGWHARARHGPCRWRLQSNRCRRHRRQSHCRTDGLLDQ